MEPHPYFFCKFTSPYFIRHQRSPDVRLAPGPGHIHARSVLRKPFCGARMLPDMDDFMFFARSRRRAALASRDRIEVVLDMLGLQRHATKGVKERAYTNPGAHGHAAGL